MIVCPKLKCAFVHVAKTGGSTVTELLAPHTVPGMAEGGDKLPRKGYGWQQRFHDGGMHEVPNLQGSEEWFTFGFCRNPYDRARSWWAAMGGGEPLPLRACDMLRDVDFVGRFETYAHDLQIVLNKLRLRPGAVPHRLDRRADDRAPLTAAQAERVRAKWGADFAEYGYDAENWRTI